MYSKSRMFTKNSQMEFAKPRQGKKRNISFQIGEKLLKHNEHSLFPRTAGCRVRDIKCFVCSRSDRHRSAQNLSFCLQPPITFKHSHELWFMLRYTCMYCVLEISENKSEKHLWEVQLYLSGRPGREWTKSYRTF